jgi:hypothetical protein
LPENREKMSESGNCVNAGNKCASGHNLIGPNCSGGQLVGGPLAVTVEISNGHFTDQKQ